MTLSDRSSHSLSVREASRIRDAAVFAFCNGWPLNLSITIHFGQIHVFRPHARLTQFLKRAGEWLRDRGGNSPAYVWVLENPLPEFGKGGIHAHILFHVPHHLAGEFDRRVEAWLVGPGKAVPNGAIYLEPVYYSGPADSPAKYIEHGLLGSLRYFLKGLDEGHAGLLGSEAKPQGETLGKRSGYSEALGRQHRWRRIPVGGRAWVGRADVKMKRWIRHHFPELLGLAD